MRHVLLLAAVLFGGVTSAWAQVSERLDVSAIVRTDRVSLEGNQHARLPVTGLGVSYRVWRDMRIEGEVTRASGESRRSYEADFFSFATTQEDYDRLAVIARRTTVNKAGLGFATAVAVETRQPGRFNIALRAGISGRQYRYSDERTILRVPDGFTVEQAKATIPDAAERRARGGLLFGASVPIRIVARFYVAPEVRWVWGGPAMVGNNYDEGSIGVRIIWKF
jgi:hypothetical protein